MSKSSNAIPRSVFMKRRDHLRKLCRDKKVDGYLTFDFSDVFYLSGFPSEGCFALVSSDGAWLFSPQLLADHARATVSKNEGMDVVSQTPLLKSLESILKKHKLKRIGFDDAKVTVSLHKALCAIPGVKWEPLSELVLRQRMVKDRYEIDLISRACHITHEASRAAFKQLKAGQTEKDVAKVLEDYFHDHGSPKPAFETIVAFEENAAYPHHVLTNAKLRKNSAVLMDLGCTMEGYRSDLTRTAYFGTMTPKFKKVYGIVQESQRAGIAAVREGVTAGFVDSVCREYIRKAGYGDYYIHGTGHGVGIDIHEPPRLGVQSKEELKAGMIVTVEPGIYLPGEFGVRIEDTLLVTKNGSSILTR